MHIYYFEFFYLLRLYCLFFLGRTHSLPDLSKNRTVSNQAHPDMNFWDQSRPSFRILDCLDDCGNYIEDPRCRRPVGQPCDGKTRYDGIKGDCVVDSMISDFDSQHVNVSVSPSCQFMFIC